MFAVVRTTRMDNVVPVSVFYVFTPSKQKAEELCKMINGWITSGNPSEQRLVISAATTGYSFGMYDAFTSDDLAEVVELKEFNPELGAKQYEAVIKYKGKINEENLSENAITPEVDKEEEVATAIATITTKSGSIFEMMSKYEK